MMTTRPTCSWPRRTFPPVVLSDPRKPRKCQSDAFAKLDGHPRMILNKPTGSGKTMTIQMLSLAAIERNPRLKVIISVPQTIIGMGFLGGVTRTENIHVPSVDGPLGGTRKWFVSRTLCDKAVDTSKGAEFVDFMRNMPGKVMVCSHAILVKAYKTSIKDGTFPDLFKDVLVWFDEAHHVQNADTETGGVHRNKLGGMMNSFLSSDDVMVGMVTATMFRGDQTAVLTKSQRDLFESYELPYDEYLESDDMHYLKEFHLQYLPCGLDFVKDVGHLLSTTGVRKDIVFIPHTTALRRFSSGGKHRVVDSIVKEYQKVHGGQIRKGPILTEIVNEGKTLRIIDFVDDGSDREAKKDYVNSHGGDKEAVDVIITMNMFQEGADWKWADRAIVVGVKASQVANVQILGRIMRDVPGKRVVTLVQLIPTFPTTDQAERRDQINDHVTVMCLNMLLVDAFQPIEISVSLPPSPSGTPRHVGDDPFKPYPEATRVAILADAEKAIVEINATIPPTASPTFVHDEFAKRMVTILGMHGITTGVEDITLKAWMLMNRDELVGRDLNGFTYDMLMAMNPINGFMAHMSMLGVDSLRELLDAWRTHEAPENKRKLLAMPVGSPKPKPSDKLYNCLNMYIRPACNSYDPVFTRDIEAKQPHWFVNSADENKKELLSVPVGSSKPKGTLYKCMTSYLDKNQRSYDPDFAKSIKKRQPTWFINKVELNKQEIMDLPVGCPRPSCRGRIGGNLVRYITKNSYSYDAEFESKIKGRQPSWFEDRVVSIKRTLLSLELGVPIPEEYKRKVGHYTTKGDKCYDEEFDNEIRKGQPGWFCGIHDSSDKKKSELKKMEYWSARPSRNKGEDTELGVALCGYTTNSDCYDEGFDREIRRTHPWWFMSRDSDENKNIILGLPIGYRLSEDFKTFVGRTRSLGSCLYAYTNPKSSAYDEKFDKKIRVRQPDWFDRRSK